MDARATAQTIGFNNEGGRIAIQAAEYHVHGDNIVNQAQEGSLEKLPYAAEAPFNAYTRQYDPECLPSTRTTLLNEIYAWTDGQDERCVYWLNGLAGTGKSTIARTVARRHYERRSLGASFFFSRGGGDIGHARRFVTSVAVQLAYNVPVSRQHICDALAKRPDVSTLTLRDQWQQLVLGPLSALNTLGNITSIVLVVDALDECDKDDDVRQVIELLAGVQKLSGPRLRVFLTSRPEVAVRHGFYDVPDTSHRCFVLHHIASSVVDADIELYLRHSLAITGREQRLPTGWPDSEIIAKLVQRASGLFIWAATAHRFIHQGKRFVRRRLDLIVKSDAGMQGEPEKRLDDIYMTILQSSLRPEYSEEEKEDQCKKIRSVLGMLVILEEPLPARALDELLGFTEEGIVSIVEDLHAILDVPADESRAIRLHHPSLRDFLLDKSRCTDARFWIDEAQSHAALASRCIALVRSFCKQNEGASKESYKTTKSDIFRSWTKYRDDVGMLLAKMEAAKAEMADEAEMAEVADFVELDEANLGRDGSGHPRNNTRVSEALNSERGYFLEGIESVLELCADTLSNHFGTLRRHEGSGSATSHDDEANYSVGLRYATFNWAHHLKQSGMKPVDHGEAHTLFTEFYSNSHLSLLRNWDILVMPSTIACLKDCVSEEDAPLFAASLPIELLRELITLSKEVCKLQARLNRAVEDLITMHKSILKRSIVQLQVLNMDQTS
ncbi:hypothetical protein ACET3X_001911 [Alternaria dauci]|uniref:Nephrocystin 3-like N-terminal domain-containing protein n=1 Tax=Alternaria dauci TaxID=48095 RepID=A0ABR3V054_9PLEO